MRISVCICTYGDGRWRDQARDEAMPNANLQHDGLHPDIDLRVVAYHWPNGTLAQVRNYAATASDGDWLCFLDADDLLCPGYFNAMHAACPQKTVTAPFGASATFQDHTALLAPAVTSNGGPPHMPNRHAPMDELNHCVIGTLVNRLLFIEAGGFRDDLPVYEDWAMWLACIRAGGHIVDVPDAVYCAASTSEGRNRRDRGTNVQTYHLIRDEHRKELHGPARR